MVITTSASATASAAEPTATQPAAAAFSSAWAERSKAATWRPALAWLAAMPPPMLPRPMKAIRVTRPPALLHRRHVEGAAFLHRALRPAGGDGLHLGVEPHPFHAVLVGVAEGRA